MNFWLGLGDLFVSHNPREFKGLHFLGLILVCAYNICQYGWILISCIIPSGSPSPPNHAYSCIPFVSVCCIRFVTIWPTVAILLPIINFRSDLLVFCLNNSKTSYSQRPREIESSYSLSLCLDVAQDRMNGAPNVTRTHSWRFACLNCLPLHPLMGPKQLLYTKSFFA